MAYMDPMGKSLWVNQPKIGMNHWDYHTDHNGNRIIFVPGMLMAEFLATWWVGGIKDQQN